MCVVVLFVVFPVPYWSCGVMLQCQFCPGVVCVLFSVVVVGVLLVHVVVVVVFGWLFLYHVMFAVPVVVSGSMIVNVHVRFCSLVAFFGVRFTLTTTGGSDLGVPSQ